MSIGDLYVENKRLSLGNRIGRGGEGEVFAVAGNTGVAAKLYTFVDARSREEKIKAMVALGLAQKTSLVAFPTSMICKRDGAFVGFLMRLVSAHRPLHDIYSPGSRKHNFPKADFRFLVRTAANIARAVASVHATGCVIGDINHSSILVSNNATVALIDADSFQLQSGSRTFYCLVGVPEYTPPELQGIPLGSIRRTPNHDAFGLAVVVFQLLFMGRHPFIGSIRKGDLPQLGDAIRDYRFVYAENRNVGMDQPPGTPVLSDFSTEVASAFEKAFSRESELSRPTAAHWIGVLTSLEASLVQCKTEPLHYYGKTASDCPWCQMETQLGTILFLPYVPAGTLATEVFDPGADAFNVDAVWAQVQSIKFLGRDQFRPTLTPFTPQPSAEATALRARRSVTPWLRAGAFVLAVITVIAIPALWFVWGGLVFYAIFGRESPKTIDTSAPRNRYISAEQRWRTALDAWHNSIGIADGEAILAQVTEAVTAYRALKAENAARVDAYKRDRRSTQLAAYLDGFEIRNATLRGIGPSKQATLASYGVETAADVSKLKVLAVPGIGETTTDVLVEWRKKLEGRFFYQDQLNDTDRQEIARIASSIAAKATNLRGTILAGKANLATLYARANSARNTIDQTLNRLHQELEQAKCDLLYLGVPLPTVPIATPVSPGRTSGASPSPASPAIGRKPSASSSVPTCPRCGSGMVRRVARRGANAGGAFWGCSRFPSCRGTRNI